MKININVEISEEAYIRLMSGKSVPGQMKKALATGVITFDDWKHKTKKQRAKDKLVHQLETGWVKESPEKYKVFLSIYKKGTVSYPEHYRPRDEGSQDILVRQRTDRNYLNNKH